MHVSVSFNLAMIALVTGCASQSSDAWYPKEQTPTMRHLDMTKGFRAVSASFEAPDCDPKRGPPVFLAGFIDQRMNRICDAFVRIEGDDGRPLKVRQTEFGVFRNAERVRPGAYELTLGRKGQPFLRARVRARRGLVFDDGCPKWMLPPITNLYMGEVPRNRRTKSTSSSREPY